MRQEAVVAKHPQVGIERVHLEEDTGKSQHVGGSTGRIHGAEYSLVDNNRAGIPLVEVVGAEATPAEVLDWAVAFYAAIGKHPLRLKKEIQSFIANRLQYAIREEANRLVEAGICDRVRAREDFC